MEHDINLDVEVTDLVEKLDDTIDEAVENFLCNLSLIHISEPTRPY